MTAMMTANNDSPIIIFSRKSVFVPIIEDVIQTLWLVFERGFM